MIDYNCPHLYSPWLVTYLAYADVLSPSNLIILILLCLSILIGIIITFSPRRLSKQSKTAKPRSWLYQLIRLATFSVLIYLSITLLPTAFAVRQGLVASIPEDPGTPADTIVILGRGGELQATRVEVANELWLAKRAPTIFVSGVADTPGIIALLKAKGIPIDVLQGENCSASTEQNALFTANILQPKGIKKIILITDPPHMLRSIFTYRSYGFEVIPHTSPIPQLTDKRKEKLWAREYSGLFFYSLLGWFLPK
jgi:uncharacterized SAM-binding protein YcdF (DUF218 family)